MKPIWERDYWPVWALPFSRQDNYYFARVVEDYKLLLDENERLRNRLALLERSNRAIVNQTRRSE